MWFIWILIPILAFFLVAVIVGTVKGAKRVARTSNLQKAADQSFRKTNGTHNFNYAIKQFGDSTSKRFKIIIVAETNFSDYGSGVSGVNLATHGKVVLKGKVTGKEKTTEFDLNSLEPSMTVVIPSDLMNEKLHVRVETDWTFSDIPLKEELEFDLD